MSDIERTVEVYDQDENYLPVVSATEKPGGGIVVTVEVEAAPPTDDRGTVAENEKLRLQVAALENDGMELAARLGEAEEQIARFTNPGEGIQLIEEQFRAALNLWQNAKQAGFTGEIEFRLGPSGLFVLIAGKLYPL